MTSKGAMPLNPPEATVLYSHGGLPHANGRVPSGQEGVGSGTAADGRTGRKGAGSPPPTLQTNAHGRHDPGIQVNGTGSSVRNHVWIVIGPAGSGKSTVAQYLAKNLQLPYVEGDEYHPKENIDKMSKGIPLTDDDRWVWLTFLRKEALKRLDDSTHGVVVTCSALKRTYRDFLRIDPNKFPNVRIHFIYLSASEDVLVGRVSARRNHYMGANMVHSQFTTLEQPSAEETDVIPVDVSKPADEVMQQALDLVKQAYQVQQQ